nr:hypothetical protein [Tanacetum cinerariifolium]
MLPEMLEDPYVEVSLQAPPSPYYIPGPEEPEQAPPSPDYIPAPADSVVVAPTAADQIPSAEETEPFETDESAATPPPHPAYPPPPSPIRSLGYRAAMIRLRDEAASTLSLPLYEVGESSSVAAARPAGDLRADYGFVSTVDREIMRDPEREVGYGITDSWDEIVETLQGAP